MKKSIIFILLPFFLVACSVKNSGEGLHSLSTQKVKENAKLAIAQCGMGNVKKVNSTGFSCKSG
jgi:hypothetical protein